MTRFWKRAGVGALVLTFLASGIYGVRSLFIKTMHSRAVLAARATLYALPLVIMDLTREEAFADPAAADAAPNRFYDIPVLANAFSRTVVRPNADTIYSTAWLDLTAEPVLLAVPPSNGRYFMIQSWMHGQMFLLIPVFGRSATKARHTRL